MARQKGLSFYRRKKKISSAVLKEIFSWIFGVVVAIFIGIVIARFFGMTISVVGDSMEETLYSGQEIMIDRFRYVLSAPKSGDVVVFLPNGNEKAHYYVKRVVAVPGDTVVIEKGVLYVNGIQSEWSDERILDAGIAENTLTMGKGEYFCVGDNINNSEDSRSANIGPVKDEDIVGRAWLALTCEEAGLNFVK